MMDSMSKRPSDNVVLAWARLIRAQHAALSHVEAALKAADLPPLSWYDALLELERVGRSGMRPFELERHLLLPQYGLSRLIGRLESAGYLERLPCEEDGRGQLLRVTKSGRGLRRRMWRVYAKAIQQAVGAHLSEAEAGRLAELLGKLYQSRTHRAA